MEISPDLVEWIVADDKVASHWVSLARRLGLTSHVAKVEVKGRRYRTDKHKLAKMMRLWKEESPNTYNVNTLKNILAAEGLNDMLMWISMMTQSNHPRREELADVVYRKLSCPTPRNLHSPGQRAHRSLSMRSEVNPTISPMGRHLYSPQPSSPYSIYFGTQAGLSRDNQRTQPYSRSFYNQGESPYSCFDSVSTSRQSTPDSTSRPTSRLSEYGYINSSPTPGYTNPSPILGGTSCPSTPLQRTSCPGTPLQRRSSNKSYLTSTWTPSPASATHRSRNRSSSPGKGVYDLLYRPDLIKLSSPYTRSRQSSDRENVFQGQESLVIEEPIRQTHKLEEPTRKTPKLANGVEYNKVENQTKYESYKIIPATENNLKKQHEHTVLELKKEIDEGKYNKTVNRKIKFENTESLKLSENGVENSHKDLNIKENNEKNYKQNNGFGIHKRFTNNQLKIESENINIKINEEVKKTVHHNNFKDDDEPKESNESTVEKAKQNIDAVIEGLHNIAIINQNNNKQSSNLKKTNNCGQLKETKYSQDSTFKKENSPKKLILSPKLDEPATVPSPRKGGNNSMDAYFDNLIILLDEAAEGLNV